MPGSSPLVAFIRDRLQRQGPVPFPWLMEQALYHSEFGYYTATTGPRIGRQGDYYTNVSVGPLYGQILASQIIEMWKILGSPSQFTVVEEGVEDGLLAMDILSALTEQSIEAAESICYIILEPIPRKRLQQQARFEPAFLKRVQWLSGLADLEGVIGAFVSNELIDAMPVHLVVYRDQQWSELLVDISGEGFCFVPGKIRLPALARALAKLPLPLSSPYTTEVNLAAARWIQSLSTKLERGFVLIADYGYPRAEYYKAERTEGTLSCYTRHRRSYNPLERLGEIDISAHVDFTALAEAAGEAGLKVAGYADQHHFMVGAAEARLLAFEKAVETEGFAKAKPAFLGQYRTLMHPGNMGMAFKFLLLTKGINTNPQLTGFKYSPDPWKSLAERL
ncbi:MAG: SAM-dependent methyltransferase [Verrucomicrobia bacterium]|nr:SAM-dependent methyltransferase [Verrucomicrobiota bacterium]